MVTVMWGVTVLAFAGAAASWILGAVAYVRVLASIGADSRRKRWLALVAWPFATRGLSGAAADQAAKVNKAIVAFFVCTTLAFASISVATNLQRLAHDTE